MPSPPELSSFADVLRGMFPWIADVSIENGVLTIRSATGRIDLAADRQPAQAGPAAARVGDFVLRLRFYPGSPGTAPSGGGPLVGTEPPALWASFDITEPYMWTQVSVWSSPGAPPSTGNSGTPVVISQGSTRVTIG